MKSRKRWRERAVDPRSLLAFRHASVYSHILAIARLRRKESLRSWALRIGVTVPTLMKMERGDPGVSAGIYATALWMMGRAGALGDIAAPETDRGALEADVRRAVSSRGTKARRPKP